MKFFYTNTERKTLFFMVKNKWNLNAYIFILKKIFLKGMDHEENGYREVRRLITVYCGYNSRLLQYTVYT